jgi:hypothetical protein
VALYDKLGRTYSATRRADPRIAAIIGAALADNKTVINPTVQAGMSLFAKTDKALLRPGLTRLAADLASGRWHDEHAELLDLDELDLGYRLVTAAP